MEEKFMKIRNTLAVLGTAILLTASTGLAQTKPTPAPATSKPEKATTHVMNGTIESISGSGDAMSVVVKGSKSSDKPVTLMLTSATTKTGDLVKGAKVNAHYRVDAGENIATSITASAAKPAAKSASSTNPPKK
jgi:hypothetical protein